MESVEEPAVGAAGAGGGPSPASQRPAFRFLNGTLLPKGELITHYYGTGHVSLDNYISQVSGQAPNNITNSDCITNLTTCAGTNTEGGTTGGLTAADLWLKHWMPLIMNSPGYSTLLGQLGAYAAAGVAAPTKPGDMPGGGQIGAVLLNPRLIAPGTVNATGSYNHYSSLRTFEDLLGIDDGGGGLSRRATGRPTCRGVLDAQRPSGVGATWETQRSMSPPGKGAQKSESAGGNVRARRVRRTSDLPAYPARRRGWARRRRRAHRLRFLDLLEDSRETPLHETSRLGSRRG